MEMMLESKLWPVGVLQVLSDASKMPRKPIFLSRIHWKYQYFPNTNDHRGVVDGLLLNRSGQTDTLGLSTDRDLFISAILSDIFCVERGVKIINVEGNIAFFGSRSAEQPTEGIPRGLQASPPPARAGSG